eukprot:UN23458
MWYFVMPFILLQTVLAVIISAWEIVQKENDTPRMDEEGSTTRAFKTVILEWWRDISFVGNENSCFKSWIEPCLSKTFDICCCCCYRRRQCNFCCWTGASKTDEYEVKTKNEFWSYLPPDSDMKNGSGLLGGLKEWQDIYPEGCPKRNLKAYFKKHWNISDSLQQKIIDLIDMEKGVI